MSATHEPDPRRARALRIAEAAADKKAEDVVALDVRELASFADTFILATGTSDRHVRTIADAVVEASRQDDGRRPVGIEGHGDGRWVLIDLGDVIVHVFQGEVRALYDLERLWSDAPPIDLDIEAQQWAR